MFIRLATAIRPLALAAAGKVESGFILIIEQIHLVAARLILAVTAQLGGETTLGRDGGDDYAVTGRLAVRF